MRLITPSILFTALVACAHHPTPASRSCSVLNVDTQLDACVGKSVTIRGAVAGTPRPSIIGVDVEAEPALYGKTAHAFGTLEKSGAQFTLKANGALAKAHATN
jgi:hypothetical protein